MKKPVKKKNEVFNRTPWSLEEIHNFTVLGTTRNNWRQRDIVLYAHPTEAESVVSVGVTFDGAMTVIAVEARSEWRTALDYAASGRCYVSN